ncbi:type II secretion system F family protein [Candidatus Peregrinibacteria bacterium]|nr:type II secretion system F family protein [Candidatus Peregrinibacteria bacterium]
MENTEKLAKLERLLGKGVQVKDPRREVIYGLYDNSNLGISTRLDDFLIDHSRVTLQEKAYFFHLLAVMIDAGIPVMNALTILASKTDSVRFARILNTVSYNLKQGNTLSNSMARFPDVFGEMELGVIRSGEAAGNLDKMLFKLSAEIDKSNELQIKLVTASIYPAAVLAVLILAGAGMMIFVIPSLIGLLKEGGLKEADFPIMTKILIGLSGFVVNYWWAIIIAFLVLYFLFKIWVESENGRYTWDIYKLKMPIIGELLRKVYVLRFISTLGILIESGLPVIKALEIVAQSLTSQMYSLKTWEVIAKVKNGEKISGALMDSPFLFPETVTQMLAVGEQTASVGKISQKIGEHYDREIDHSLKRLMSLFEPIMIVMVGVTVALLALAVLTPIFKLTSLV